MKRQASQQSQQNYDNPSFDIAERDLGSNQERQGAISNSYQVQQGDSLWGIANTRGFVLDNLLAVNGMNEHSAIHPGMNLQFPTGTGSSANYSEYTINTGDSLWSISEKHNTSMDRLLSLNNLNQWSTIHPGQTLKIPTSASTQNRQTSQSTNKATENKATENKKANTPNGYDPILGKELARASMAESGGYTRAGGKCYYYVANAVDRVIGRFLSGMHAYMAASQLAQRKDLFTEISAGNLRSLPAGAIVVWGKGSSASGHISIAQGNGMETSDFIGNQMTSHYGGAPARVFLPKARM